ncbi:MAG TPA: FG-GAP-like repeat-containing protein [Mucilaginibacter sp.]|jgi:gliding motility-associated-like protein|nr:FG-GAP-like repeat-containing protein [Mucilaginibacter sp.]
MEMIKTAAYAFIKTRLLLVSIILFGSVDIFAQSAPAISSFSPASGPLGTAVIITGTGFNATAASNIVFFGATRAAVTAASATSVTVMVPAGATYQPISILNSSTGLTGYSDQPFVTTFAPNQGSITKADFMPPVTFYTGSSGSFVSVSDIDGDGKPDLILFSVDNNTMSVFRNTSVKGSITASSFAPHVDFATGNTPTCMAVGDLDGDGKPDAAVVNNADSTISVFRNTSTKGTISFAPPIIIAERSGPSQVVIGDIDGDGKPDLLVISTAYIKGQDPSTYITTISVCRNISVTGAITTNSFAPGIRIFSGQGGNIIIGDLDGDGKPDIAMPLYYAGEVVVLRNTSTPGIINTNSFAAPLYLNTRNQPTLVFPFSVSIGDIDGDGKPDLVVVNSDSEYNNLCIFRNTSTVGSVSFAPQVNFLTGHGYPTFAAIGDLDGDGKPDVALVGKDQDSISVFRNTSTAGSITANSLAPGVNFFMGFSPKYGNVAIADLDGDGKPDLLASNGYNYTGATVSILRNAPVLPLSKIATLTNLTISNGTLTPAFESGTLTYTDTVANTVTSVTVTPTVTDTTATVKVNGVTVASGTASGAIPLVIGPNTIKVVVTAQDGTTTNTYTITVIRAASSDASLIDLTVSEGTLTPVFNSGTTAYTDSVSNLITSITVTPTTSNNYATVTINGVVVASGTPSNAIPLAVGENTITVIVTAQDGLTTDTYTIHVYRGEATTSIYVPNAFTPNGDGKNDQVHVHSESIQTMSFYIYDQWGELIFTTTNIQNGWDGTYKGTKEPVGVYVYYLQATMIDGQKITKKGTITLIR